MKRKHASPAAFTDNGPRLTIDAADLRIRATSNIAVTCERFQVSAREGISLAGAEAALTATKGDVAITANDYVKVVGEQIRLNCDGPDRVPPWMEKEISAQLARARRTPGPEGATTGLPPRSEEKKEEDDL